MKKVIFGTALASMALLSACSSDNELANVGTSANNAIGFHVVGNKAETRAKSNIIDNNNITDTDFRVFAFTRSSEDGSDVNAFMGEKVDTKGQTGVKIDYINNDWNYVNASDLHYWPTSTALNFYAVSPADVATNMFGHHAWSIEKGAKTISYSCCDEYNNSEGAVNYDLMYDIQKNQTQAPNNGKVKFQFKHMLSQIVFQAKTQLEDMQVDIKDIKIHNIKHGGTFTFPTTRTEDGSWSLSPILANPSQPGNAFTVVKDKSITVKNTVIDISSDTPMLTIPQQLTAWDVTTPNPKTKMEADAADPIQSYLEISCRIQQKGEYLFGKDGYDTIYVPFGTTWQIGKRHIYTLIFGGGYNDQGQAILKPINFDAKTTDWVDADSNIDM